MSTIKAKYFKHDCNARNDDKLTALRIEHGPAGYGVYFMILERLREEENYQGQMTDRYIRALAYDFHAEASLIRTVIQDFGLFEVDEQAGTFHSPRFDEEMQFMENLSKTRREAINQRWAGRNDEKTAETNTATGGQQEQKNTNEKKSDTNESQNEYKSNDFVSLFNPPPTTPLNKIKYNNNDLTEGNKKGDENEGKPNTNESQNEYNCMDPQKPRPFTMPDETPEAQNLRDRLKAVDWPESWVDEFMRLADYGRDNDAPAIKYLALYEHDRMEYAPTDNTPTNIMTWLRAKERRREIQPLENHTILVLRRLKPLNVADSVKIMMLQWIETSPGKKERQARTETLNTAITDIGKGKINNPDAFLISRTKR